MTQTPHLTDSLLEQLNGQRLPVVFPEAQDPRVAEAIAWLEDRAIVTPIPLVDAPSDAHIAALTQTRDLKPSVAQRLLKRPLYRAAAMVAAGEAVTMVAGADAPTRRVIEAAAMAIGPDPEMDGTVSSIFLMRFPDGRDMIFADCAVNVSPSATTLAAIARAATTAGQALLGNARPALLSYSTGTSGAGPSVDLVREAALLSHLPGPMQADAALNPHVAAKKGLGGVDANVLIFPDLNAGNIAYKLAQELAGAQSIGPILQGFRKPVCDLSRGATSDDIAASAMVTLALAVRDRSASNI